MQRRTYLAGLAGAGVAGLSGCLGADATPTGTLATRVTDQPGDIADFESCVVTIVGMWLGTDETDETSREYYEYDEPATADLVDLQGENTQLVDTRDLEVGEYAFLQLDTDGVDATLADGEPATVEVPGAAPLTFDQPFELRENTRTTFTADFTPVQRGQAGGYILQPVAEGVSVTYDDIGGDGGNEA